MKGDYLYKIHVLLIYLLLEFSGNLDTIIIPVLTLPLIASAGLALGIQLMDQAAEPAFAEFQLL